MNRAQLDVKLRRKQHAVIFDMRGAIDGFAEQTLTAAYAEAGATKPAAILLNFEQVAYINSTGIALIIGLLINVRRSGRRLLAYGLSDHYVEIFRITRLADAVSMFADEERALHALDRLLAED
jgi:anti-sigma B factor antagonist